MLHRFRRSLRVSRRRARMARRAWVRHSMDATLPNAVAHRVLGWASTPRGRAVLSMAAVVVLLGWAILFLVVVH
jgi:hypothetical protein